MSAQLRMQVRACMNAHIRLHDCVLACVCACGVSACVHGCVRACMRACIIMSHCFFYRLTQLAHADPHGEPRYGPYSHGVYSYGLCGIAGKDEASPPLVLVPFSCTIFSALLGTGWPL